MHVDRIDPYTWPASRSPLELHGATLAQDAAAGIVLWDALAMRPVRTHALSHRSFCFLRDGTLLVFAVPEKSDHCLLHRIARSGKVRTLFGPHFTGGGFILPARSATDYYVLRDRHLMVLDEEHGRVEMNALLDLPDGGATKLDLVYSLGDGRVVVGGSRIHIMDRAKPVQTYEVKQDVRRIAAMPKDRCWYAFSTTGERTDGLALASITDPTKEEQRVTFAREHVVHMASSPAGELAVLLFWLQKDPAPPKKEQGWTQDDFEQGLRWAVLVLDATGRERWRAEVPRENTAGTGFDLNTKGFVVINEHRVVMRGMHETLFAWDTATGAPVVVRSS